MPDGGDADDRLVKLVHDLRTPLTVIGGFAELLERQRAGLTEEQRGEYIARIAAAAREMSAILDAEREQRLSSN
jgi:signal transduction histidine kinase